MAIARRRLQQYALAISIVSIVYNAAEGAVSIAFGADVDSRSLLFFGVQSGVEVLSALLVVYRFRQIAPPGDEPAPGALSPSDIRLERISTQIIGVLFLLLAASTWGTSAYSLATHSHPQTALPSIIISASALGIMILIWLPKVYLYKHLNSSAMKAEAQCSLACIYLTIVLLGGSIIYRFWTGGWWVDSAIAIILGVFFAKEGVEMVRWARDPEFTGGCCRDCRVDSDIEAIQRLPVRCSCCMEKQQCKESEQCMCPGDDDTSVSDTCSCRKDSLGSDCCAKAAEEHVQESRSPARDVCSGHGCCAPDPAITVLADESATGGDDCHCCSGVEDDHGECTSVSTKMEANHIDGEQASCAGDDCCGSRR